MPKYGFGHGKNPKIIHRKFVFNSIHYLLLLKINSFDNRNLILFPMISVYWLNFDQKLIDWMN